MRFLLTMGALTVFDFTLFEIAQPVSPIPETDDVVVVHHYHNDDEEEDSPPDIFGGNR